MNNKRLEKEEIQNQAFKNIFVDLSSTNEKNKQIDVSNDKHSGNELEISIQKHIDTTIEKKWSLIEQKLDNLTEQINNIIDKNINSEAKQITQAGKVEEIITDKVGLLIEKVETMTLTLKKSLSGSLQAQLKMKKSLRISKIQYV